MKKTIIIAGAILALGFTAAQAHDSRGNSNTGLANVTANVGGLLGLNANIGSSRSGLLNVTANVGQQSQSSSLLNVDANVGGQTANDPIPFWLEGGKRIIPNISDFRTKGFEIFADRARRHTGLSLVGSFVVASALAACQRAAPESARRARTVAVIASADAATISMWPASAFA